MNRDKNKEIQVFDTAEQLCDAAAGLILEMADRAVRERGRFLISLSGGRTPEQLYRKLASSPTRERLPWENTYVFWGDERCVPMDNPENNAFVARQVLLSKTGIPAENIFPIPVNLTPAGAAKTYEQAISDFFGHEEPRFDCMLLGMGADAHTASLFPGTMAVHDKEHLVAEQYVEEVQMFRVTMTARLINDSRNIIFLVTGKAKAHALQQVMAAPFDPDKYPAQLIRPTAGKLYWLVDKEAAALL